MRFVEYGAPAKQILATPNHYVALGFQHPQATSEATGLAVLEDGRYIVKAGTIYPANDATAIGVILNDYDVTDGDQTIAVIIHGFIKTAALPAVPTADAIAAMKQISFVPIAGIELAFTGTKAAIKVGDTADPDPVVFKLVNGEFRDGAETLTNWTFTGESDTKVKVKSISIAADKKTATFTLEQTGAAVAGSVTALPSASIINIGKTVAAVTIATVTAV